MVLVLLNFHQNMKNNECGIKISLRNSKNKDKLLKYEYKHLSNVRFEYIKLEPSTKYNYFIDT